MKHDPFKGAPTLDEVYRYHVKARSAHGGHGWLEIGRRATKQGALALERDAMKSGAWATTKVVDAFAPPQKE